MKTYKVNWFGREVEAPEYSDTGLSVCSHEVRVGLDGTETPIFEAYYADLIATQVDALSEQEAVDALAAAFAQLNVELQQRETADTEPAPPPGCCGKCKGDCDA